MLKVAWLKLCLVLRTLNSLLQMNTSTIGKLVTQNMKMIVVQVETKTVVKSFTMELYSLVVEGGGDKPGLLTKKTYIRDQRNYVRYRCSLLV